MTQAEIKATTPTYNGQSLNQGVLTPGPQYDEGYAVLACGGTEVRLTYTMLNYLSGWIARGAQGASTAIPLETIKAVRDSIDAITGEAAHGSRGPQPQTF